MAWRTGGAEGEHMQLHGKQLIGGETSAEGTETLTGVNPATGDILPTKFFGATAAELDRAMALASEAHAFFRRTSGQVRGDLLSAIATQIDALGDALIERAQAETGLPATRLQGERGRTLTQLRLFAELAREGSWVDACIDRADPDRKPIPKPDVRAMSLALGPVAVFGASNFPLAISVVGNDTVAALSVGCPVIVKAHGAHPGTSEMMAGAVAAAITKQGLPPGIFAMLHGTSRALGSALVRHPLTKAVAFTGSLAGGRALFDEANARPDPIPVYAEMSSLNPVILLPGALAERSTQIAKALVDSINLGVGQFCTKPGLIFGVTADTFDEFSRAAGKAVEEAVPGTMLRPSIHAAYITGLQEISGTPGVKKLGTSATPADPNKFQGVATLFAADAETYDAQKRLAEENFGPSALIIGCRDRATLTKHIQELEGHLAASVWATDHDLKEYADIIELLETKVGRIVMNGVSTGIELCTAMVHGGPYPATTFSQYTSMGQRAFKRFVRPVCYQNFPQHALPEALQDANPQKIWRTVDGQVTRDGL